MRRFCAFAVLLADALRVDAATGRGPGGEDCRSAVRGRHGAAVDGDGPRLGDFKYRAYAIFVRLGPRGGHLDLVDLRHAALSNPADHGYRRSDCKWHYWQSG